MWQGIRFPIQVATDLTGWTVLTTILFAVFSGVIGVLTGWLGAYLKVKGENLASKEDFEETRRRLAETTSAVEDIKAGTARRTSLDTELREAVRAFTVAVGALVHSICWLTWDCKERRRLDPEMVRRYDDEMHELAPQILGQLAVVAMLNPNIHAKLSPLAEDVFDLDAKVGEAVVLAEKDLEAGLVKLCDRHKNGSDLEARFREIVSHVFSAETRLSHFES